MNLNELRKDITEIDVQLVQLFIKRMNLAAEIAKSKIQNNQPVLDHAREREVLNLVAELAGEKMESYSKRLFNTLFDLSRAYQNQLFSNKCQLAEQIKTATCDMTKHFPLKASVACQGTEGSYSQQACDKLFSSPRLAFFKDFESVFQAVEKGLCEYGILPVENSLTGTVIPIYDLMEKYKFYIVRSTRLKINHTLLAKKGVALADIREIISQEQAIKQCSQFINNHPQIKVTLFSNTAAAAKYVADSGRTDLAAISSETCAQLYNLDILTDNIQNRENNYTRFICISKDLKIYPGANKISLILSLQHKPGSLGTLLGKFSSLGFNLTKLESRPITGKDFEFMFYFDFEAPIYSTETVNLLCELVGSHDKFIFLGSYSENY
ncbi:bifunctional chorismate mutase/prephenate dehydratase [Desulfotomaculum sp. 1211_IL3151]|uniref:bifunctional chorismate mutase/prephenate dehydratase n=1 Tax=Desulfotomaculum sp. 1211_IL3151 TaxID=3084055 RepID=UPI002FD99358